MPAWRSSSATLLDANTQDAQSEGSDPLMMDRLCSEPMFKNFKAAFKAQRESTVPLAGTGSGNVQECVRRAMRMRIHESLDCSPFMARSGSSELSVVMQPAKHSRLHKGVKVGRTGKLRNRMTIGSRPDLFSHSGLPAGYQSGVEDAQARFSMVTAFVARRMYQHLRVGRSRNRLPPLIEQFNEDRFLYSDVRFFRTAVTNRGCCCLFSRRVQVSVEEVFDFLFNFASWCAMPADLLIVALVYLDRVLDKVNVSGALGAKTWRPLLVGCLVLASKVWEDYCICNFEAAYMAQFTKESMLRLELLVLDALDWNANITAEVFAQYFWAAEQAMEKGTDTMSDSTRTPSSSLQNSVNGDLCDLFSFDSASTRKTHMDLQRGSSAPAVACHGDVCPDADIWRSSSSS
jgi:hypothetical protein